MDIKKDEAFELAFSKTNFYKGMVESLKNKDCPFESVFEIRNGKYRSSYVQLSHEIWQAAKAVPEGFVLVPTSLSDKQYNQLEEVMQDNFGTTVSQSRDCIIKIHDELVAIAQEPAND